MPTRALTVLTAIALLTVACVARASGSWASGDPSSGGCGASGYPAGYGIWCQGGQGGGSTPGSPGTVADPGGGGVPDTPCALYPVAGNATHMLQVCPLPNPNGGLRYAVNRPGGTATLVPVGGGNGGGPPITPQQLLAWAQSKLALPLPAIRTAPPQGSDGLVGLPEWFWVAPGQWHPMSARVQVGGVWAQVTADPEKLDLQPGTGASLVCPGPGTPYNPRLAASAQRASCSYLYTESSDGLPGNAFQVSVTVVWTATWQGSGGAGGALAPLGRTAAFGLPVAEAQALNPGS
jgi:hypothetical protein